MSNNKQKTLLDNELSHILFKLLLEYSLLMRNIYTYKSISYEDKNKGILSKLKNLVAYKELPLFNSDTVISELSNTIHLICMSLSNEYSHGNWIFPMYAEYTKEFLEFKFGKYEELEKIDSAFPRVLDVLVEFGDICRKRAEGLNGDS